MTKIKHPNLLASFVILAAIFLVYSVSLGHNFLFDEENLIINNPTIKDLSLTLDLFKRGFFYFEGRPAALWDEYYRPLTALSFAVDYHFWRGNPLGYNLTNLFLHSAACLLLYRLLLRLFNDKRAAFLSAFLYGIHTIHVEAVTYIASRSDLLAGGFILLILNLFWEGRYRWALFFYGISLFAKESALIIPLYLILLDTAVIKSSWRRVVVRAAPFLILMGIYWAYRKFLCPVPLGPPTLDLKLALLRFLSMGNAFLSYLQALVLPDYFIFGRQVKFAVSMDSPVVYKTVFILLLIFIGWLAALRRRGPVFFGLSFFLLALLPCFQIIHFFPEWAEHYLYIPSMGLAILFAALVSAFFKINRRWVIIAFLCTYGAWAAFLGYRTWTRNTIYNDAGKFYSTLARSGSPYAFYGYQNMARLAIEKNDWEGAYLPLKTALAIEPRSGVTNQILGVYYRQRGEFEKAVNYFDTAARVDVVNRHYYWMDKADALTRLKALDRALEVLLEVQKTNPDYFVVYPKLLAVYELLGDLDSGIKWIDAGLNQARGDFLEGAKLEMASLRARYRNGRLEEVKTKLPSLSKKYASVFWYGDILNYLSGNLSESKWLALFKGKYADFRQASLVYNLMYCVLNKRPDLFRELTEKEKTLIGEMEVQSTLFQKEMKQARELLL